MRYSGSIELPLHSGRAPYWLLKRMERIADLTCSIIIQDKGAGELLSRLSDPLWFQAYGCALGFDWHSSGVTTVLTGVLSRALSIEKHGMVVLGGKGRRARNVVSSIERACNDLGIPECRKEELKRASRLCAKVDTVAVQSGYELYHHSFVLSEKGEWAVIQQGMNKSARLARRMHWLGKNVNSFVNKPHSGFYVERVEERVLNLTDPEISSTRDDLLELVNKDARKVYSVVTKQGSSTLDRFIEGSEAPSYSMPLEINFGAVERAYSLQPSSFEELLLVEGLGPRTLRALCLISELLYGSRLSWRDPAKYSFAFGGKDGVPFPVDRKAYDETISYLKQVVEGSEFDSFEKKEILRRLSRFEN